MSMDSFDRDLIPFIAMGKKCSLWGVKTLDMSREQLLGFVGFLDELCTNEMRGQYRRHCLGVDERTPSLLLPYPEAVAAFNRITVSYTKGMPLSAEPIGGFNEKTKTV